MDEFGAELNGVWQRGILLRADASANSVAGFEDFNIHSRACEIDRGCEAGDTRADDNDVRRHCADLDAGFCASGVTTSEADAGSKSEFFRHERDFPSTQVLCRGTPVPPCSPARKRRRFEVRSCPEETPSLKGGTFDSDPS